MLPRLPVVGTSGDAYDVAGDPSVAVGPDGVARFGCLNFETSGAEENAIVVYTITFDINDDITSVTSTKVAESTDIEVFHDKPYIAVDPADGDNVYISWTRFLYEVQFPFLVFKEARIYFAYSDDGGATFSTPAPLSGPLAQASVPAVGPDGEVYVTWLKFPEFEGDDFDIRLRKSTDGGVVPFAFDSEITVVDDFDPIPSPLPGGSYRVNSFPSIAVDTSGGSNNGTVYLVYAADPAGNDKADIFLTRFTVGATNWTTPLPVNDDATDAAQFFPWISVGSDGQVDVVWYDRRGNDKAIDTYVAFSTNGGANFSINERVSDFSFTPNKKDQFGGEFIGDYNAVASGSILPLWTTLVVIDQPRGPGLQDYEVFFDSVATVTDNTDPSVTVKAPDGGESWVVGAVRAITWDAMDNVGVTSVDLSYSSTGSGGSFNTIATGEANDGTFSWTIPNDPTTNAFVKVVAHDGADNSGEDLSNAAFTIVAAPLGDTPTVSACDPDSGSPGQQLIVAVMGSNFQDGATVDFGERVMVQNVTFVSGSQLEVKIKVHPRAASDLRDVTVTNPDGQFGTKTACFEVN